MLKTLPRGQDPALVQALPSAADHRRRKATRIKFRPARPHPRAPPRPRPGGRRSLRRRTARRVRRGRHRQGQVRCRVLRAYLDEHRAEITAIQLIGEARDRRIAFPDLQELADRIARPPYNWTPDIIWDAYVALGAPPAWE
jgi:hypothetical protein